MRIKSKLNLLIMLLFLFVFTGQVSVYAVDAVNPNDLKGQEVPIFYLKDQNNNPFKLEDHIGKVIVVNFFFTGCKSCRKELPMLYSITKELPKDKFILSVINGTKETPDAIKGFFKDINVEGLSALVDSLGIQAKRFNISDYPTSFLVDKSGVVVDVFVGFPEGNLSELQKKINNLIGN